MDGLIIGKGMLPDDNAGNSGASGGWIDVKGFRRHWGKRLGAALGLWAVLGLAVMAPIHHVHAIQRDFAGLGHAGQSDAAAHHADGAGHAHHGPFDQPGKPPIYCPICSLGKMAGSLLPPSIPTLVDPPIAAAAPAPAIDATSLSGRAEPAARPRAPPVPA